MSPKTTFAQLEISQLRANEKNIRTDYDGIDELADSIRAQGLLQPLLVTPHPEVEGDYLVIGGHRRLMASRQAGLLSLPCMITSGFEQLPEQIEAMLSENTHRSNLSPVEESDAYQRLLEFPGYTVERIAKRTGRSEATIRRRVALTKIGDTARQQLSAGEITLDRAQVIAEFDGDTELQDKVVDAATKGDWEWNSTVNHARKRVQWAKDKVAAEGQLKELVIPVFASAEDARSEGYQRLFGADVGDLPRNIEALMGVTLYDPAVGPATETHEIAAVLDDGTMSLTWWGKPHATEAQEEAGPTEEELAEQAAREKAETALRIDRASADKHLRELLLSPKKIKDTARQALAYTMSCSGFADDYVQMLSVEIPEDISQNRWSSTTKDWFFEQFLGFTTDQLALAQVAVEHLNGRDRFYSLYSLENFNPGSNSHDKTARNHSLLAEVYGMEESEGVRLARAYWEPVLPGAEGTDASGVNF